MRSLKSSKTTRSSTATTTIGRRKRIVVVKLGPLSWFWILVVVVIFVFVVAMVWWRFSSNNNETLSLRPAWQVNNRDTTMVMDGKDCPVSQSIEAGAEEEEEEEEEQEDQRRIRTSTSMKQRLRSLLHDAVLMNQYLDQVVTTTKFSNRRRRRRDVNTAGGTRAMQSESKTTTSSITTPDDEEDEEEDTTRRSKNKNEVEDTKFDNDSSSSSPAPPAVVGIDEVMDDEQAATAKAMLSRRLDEFDRRVRLAVPDIDHRHVPWGGTLRWYGRDLLEKYYRAGMDLRTGSEKISASAVDNSNSNNGTDFWWATHVPFPRTKCLHHNKRPGRNNIDASTTSSDSTATSGGGNGNGGGSCRIEESILYTLQWREIYQPWKFTSSMRRQNQGGFIYAHGRTATRSLSPEGQWQHHGIVWYRPSRLNAHARKGGRSQAAAAAIDPVSYFRCVFHGIERAIAPTGTFVAVVDAADFGWHHVPYPWHYWARQTINMLKDHYPHRLGYVVLINMSPMTELVLQLVRPWLPSRVRGLLRFCKSQGELAAILGQEALDEDDRFVFRTEHYYEPAAFHMSDAEGEEYLKFIEPQAT